MSARPASPAEPPEVRRGALLRGLASGLVWIMDRVASRVPLGWTVPFEGGRVEAAYRSLRMRAKRAAERLARVELATPAGPIALSVPAGSAWTRREEHEPTVTRELAEVLGPSAVFYDVGALWGYYASLARAVGVPREGVHAFETDPYRCSVLRRNLSGTGARVVCARVGEAAAAGRATVTLDEYRRESGEAPTVVKVDVEGGEAAVIRGMEEVLRRDRPLLFVEVHPEKMRARGERPADLLARLRRRGYALEDCGSPRSRAAGWRPTREERLPSTGELMVRAVP